MERWIGIGAGLTAGLGIAAYALLPVTRMTGAPSYDVALLWLTLVATVILCHAFRETVRMARRGEERPLAALLGRIEPKQALVVGGGSLLLALNLAFFCTVKPQLGQLVPFTADPMLADLDHLLFFGHEPWRLLMWLDHPGLALVYHRGWFLWLAFVTYWVLKQPPGAEKDRLLIGYLLLWSVFGPLVHLAFPAAGPVFFNDLGFGDRFADLRQSPETRELTAYLWSAYVHRTLDPGAGISAMPSLHLATMFWALIAVRKTRWLPFGIAFTAYIFAASIVIGWHYAIDGLAGFAGAWLCYAVAGVGWGRSGARPELATAESRLVG
jgi:hypothetical protein